MKKLMARFLSWILQDQILFVGSLGVCHPHTTYTDTIQEKSTNAGVQVIGLRPGSGTSFPASPNIGQFFHRTDENKMYVFIGVGQPGTYPPVNGGWFNLKYAQYAL